MKIFHKKGTKEYQKITFSVENDFKIRLNNYISTIIVSIFRSFIIDGTFVLDTDLNQDIQNCYHYKT